MIQNWLVLGLAGLVVVSIWWLLCTRAGKCPCCKEPKPCLIACIVVIFDPVQRIES